MDPKPRKTLTTLTGVNGPANFRTMTLEELKIRTLKNGHAENSGVQENFFKVTLVCDNVTDDMVLHCDGCFNEFNNISLYIPVEGCRPLRNSDYASEYTDWQGKRRGNVHWRNITDSELSNLKELQPT